MKIMGITIILVLAIILVSGGFYITENQCSEHREGKVKHFIELDKEGNIVRIV